MILRGPDGAAATGSTSSLAGALCARQRDGELAAAAGPLALHRQGPAVHLDEALGDGQAEAKPPVRTVEAAASLREDLEDARQQRFGDSPAVVDHVDRHRVVAAVVHLHPDIASSGRELRGIGEEIHDHLLQARGVGAHVDGSVRHRHGQPVLAPLQERSGGLHGLRDEPRHVRGDQLQLDGAAGDARDVQQVIDQPGHVLDLPFDDGPHTGRDAGVALGEREELRGGPDRGERRAELVREHREELVFPPVGLEREIGRLLPLDRDRCRVREERDDLLFLRRGRTRLTEIRIERTEHPVARRDDGHRPRRLESGAEREMLEARPLSQPR